jgi:hypothetical protein
MSGNSGQAGQATLDTNCDEVPYEQFGACLEANAEPAVNRIPQAELFSCASSKPASSPSRLRRVDQEEWAHNIGQPLTDSGSRKPSIASSNPFRGSLDNPYSSYDQNNMIDATTLDLYLRVLPGAGVGWTAVLPSSAGGMNTRVRKVLQDKKLQCMFSTSVKPNAACIDYYLGKFLHHGVLFRAPTEEEKAPLAALAQTVLDAEPAAPTEKDRTLTMRQITSAAWLMPQALFRSEMGDGVADEAGRQRLTDDELARQLAYVLEKRAPGAPASFTANGAYSESKKTTGGYSTSADGYLFEIVQAALDGSIQDAEKRRTIIKNHSGGLDPQRMDLYQDRSDNLRSQRGEYWLSTGIARFFREWLGYEKARAVFKDRPQATSKFDDPKDGAQSGYQRAYNSMQANAFLVEPLLVEQMDDTIARIVAADQDVLKNLLTSTQFYVPSNDVTGIDPKSGSYGAKLHLPRVYNIEGDVTPTREDRWRTLPTTERAGVLTHPAWLAAHGNNFEDDPSLIHRGKWVQENLLCGTVPPLRLVTVAAMVPPQDAQNSLTARQRVIEATHNEYCLNCHKKMNPLGFPFEIYNHAGFVRVTDHGKAPDGSSLLENMPDPKLDGPVTSAIDFSQKLADSPEVTRCFIRQVFRYFMGRDETLEDACTLTAMEDAYTKSQGSFQALLGALVASDTFVFRHIPAP